MNNICFYFCKKKVWTSKFESINKLNPKLNAWHTFCSLQRFFVVVIFLPLFLAKKLQFIKEKKNDDCHATWKIHKLFRIFEGTFCETRIVSSFYMVPFFFLILLLQFFFLLLNMSKYANNFWIISIDAEHVQSYEDLISNKLSLKYLESFVQFMDFNVFLVVAISSISNEWMLSSVSAIRQRISYSIWIKSRLW